MSDQILGGANDGDGADSRFGLKLPTRNLSINRKSYLFKSKDKQDKKANSEQRRDAIKSSLFQVLDHDDTSVTCDFVSDDDYSYSGKASTRGLNHKRSKSVGDEESKTGSSQPRLRGKKAELLEKKNIPGPPVTDRATRSRSMGMGKSPNVSVRKTQSSTRPALPNRTGTRRERSKSDASSAYSSKQDPNGSLAPPPPRRKSSMSFLTGGFSRQSEEDDESSKKREDFSKAPKRTVARRSMSLGPERKRTEANSPKQKQRGKGALGAFLAKNPAADVSDEEDDGSSDGGDSVTSATSWITWAASTALKPLEKLYDDLNGVDDRGPKKVVSSDDDSESNEEDGEFPNTHAESFAATRLSTTEKIAGLRFVASKQRRQSLYM